MRISKKDALLWFRFFAELPEGEELLPRQQEIALAVLSQLEDAAEAKFDRLRSEIPDFRSLDGRTDYVGNPEKFPRGCRSCLTGTGLSAVRKTNRCNLSCPFCYDYGCLDAQPPVGEDTWEIGGTKYRTRDLPMLLSLEKKPTGVAYVYLEPFCEIHVYYDAIRAFAAAGVHQHMYTNGTLANRENLRALGEAGLDELRFNLGASRCHPRVLEAIRIAKEYIPSVGIETPMTREFWADFHARKREILDSGADFMNCAELHLSPNNVMNYEGESFYLYRQGYLSPVFSREFTLRFMREAAEEGWDLLVHDCSNRTKFMRDLHQRAAEGAWFGASSYGSEFDAIPYALLIPALEDPDLPFVAEEPLPAGYRPGDIVL